MGESVGGRRRGRASSAGKECLIKLFGRGPFRAGALDLPGGDRQAGSKVFVVALVVEQVVGADNGGLALLGREPAE